MTKRERFHRVEDHLEALLIDWAAWMRAKWDGGRPREAAGCLGGGYTSDFDDMCATVDRNVAKIVDRAIEDLGVEHPTQRLAIYITYGIAEGSVAVWRLREPVDVVYERAKENLAPRLKKKGVWLGE